MYSILTEQYLRTQTLPKDLAIKLAKQSSVRLFSFKGWLFLEDILVSTIITGHTYLVIFILSPKNDSRVLCDNIIESFSNLPNFRQP